MKRRTRLAIIGGGWAGLACAEALCGTSASATLARDITLFEAAPELGGRARGLVWKISPERTVYIDNGQHLTVGAYDETLALLRRVGAPAWQAQPLLWAGVSTNGQLAQSWTVPQVSFFMRLLTSAFGQYAPKDWPLAWRWSLAKTLLYLITHRWQAKGTALAWLTQQRVPRELIEHFWRPLTEGALNTALEEASAAVLMRVMKDTLGGGPLAASVITPKHNLSIDGVDPIADYLHSHQVTLLRGHRVNQISANGDLQAMHGSVPLSARFDAIVLALPSPASQRLWSDSLLPPTPTSLRWADLATRAITTIWIACDAAATKRLAHLPAWFVLNPQPDLPHIAQVAVQRQGVLALVMSARELSESNGSLRDELTPPLTQQIRAQLGIDLTALPQKWITEKSATWACTPDAPIAGRSDVSGRTGLARIFRAADDLEPGYPATIESAVRSGRRTAQTIIANESALRPDPADSRQ
jgi:hydroxysqualene dehydroxylase